jgi:hypothetical protein
MMHGKSNKKKDTGLFTILTLTVNALLIENLKVTKDYTVYLLHSRASQRSGIALLISHCCSVKYSKASNSS